ncbi:DUF4296 domain-containing protein [Mucilaginibacter sp. CSA2-8R]|uniref:DUF4296 domain-containing protein n=1 Tax=Mucilaginibacter sp. CSA2-8R TaxID=3141542 RepID=UPI00315D6E5F
MRKPLNYRKRIYYILFFLVMFFLCSCKSDKPKEILSHEQMEHVLIEIHVVDGTLTDKMMVPDTMFKYGNAQYMQIFKQQNIDSGAFKKSFKYYTNRPDELFEIYDKVIADIKVRVDSATKVKEKRQKAELARQMKENERIAKRAADSIARLNKAKADSLHKKTEEKKGAGKNKLRKDKNVIPRK